MKTQLDFIPCFPLPVYMEWVQQQDIKVLKSNCIMWGRIMDSDLREAYETKRTYSLRNGTDIEDFGTFRLMSYCIHAYHVMWDGWVREEIEEIIKSLK